MIYTEAPAAPGVSVGTVTSRIYFAGTSFKDWLTKT